MNTKDIWYGVLEAGEKSSPVVRDVTIEAADKKIYLYNYVRNQFIEYSQAIVEPKLRDLTAGDISYDELDKAFRAARQAFISTRKIKKLADTKPAVQRVKNDDDDAIDIDISDDDFTEEFIDDD